MTMFIYLYLSRSPIYFLSMSVCVCQTSAAVGWQGDQSCYATKVTRTATYRTKDALSTTHTYSDTSTYTITATYTMTATYTYTTTYITTDTNTDAGSLTHHSVQHFHFFQSTVYILQIIKVTDSNP